MITPINPEKMSFNEWAAQLISDNTYDILPFVSSEEKWKEWGNNIISTSYLDSLDIPSPDDLGENITWQEWASYVYAGLLNQTKST